MASSTNGVATNESPTTKLKAEVCGVQTANDIADLVERDLGSEDHCVHVCLAELHGDSQMATEEVKRSAGVLRRAAKCQSPSKIRYRPEDLETLLEAPPAGRVLVYLPTKQPLFSLVVQVVIPALACTEVRVVLPADGTREAFAKTLCWFKECFAQMQNSCIGAITVESSAEGPSPLDFKPVAVIATPSMEEMLELNRYGVPIIIPQRFSSCALIAALPDGTAHIAGAVDEIWRSAERNSYRPGGVYDIIFVHEDVQAQVLERFKGLLKAQKPPLSTRWPIALGCTDISAVTRLQTIFDEAAKTGLKFLALLVYKNDEDLEGLATELKFTASQISLFGRSPMMFDCIPRCLMTLGTTVCTEEDEWHYNVLDECRVFAKEEIIPSWSGSKYNLLATLRRLTTLPDDVSLRIKLSTAMRPMDRGVGIYNV